MEASLSACNKGDFAEFVNAREKGEAWEKRLDDSRKQRKENMTMMIMDKELKILIINTEWRQLHDDAQDCLLKRQFPDDKGAIDEIRTYKIGADQEKLFSQIDLHKTAAVKISELEETLALSIREMRRNATEIQEYLEMPFWKRIFCEAKSFDKAKLEKLKDDLQEISKDLKPYLEKKTGINY